MYYVIKEGEIVHSDISFESAWQQMGVGCELVEVIAERTVNGVIGKSCNWQQWGGAGMTRKDYIRIANAFKRTLSYCGSDDDRIAVWLAIDEVAAELLMDNGSFSVTTFKEACDDRT